MKAKRAGPTKVGWRTGEWGEDAGGFSRPYVYRLMNAGYLKSVKVGTARIITTSPQEFLVLRLRLIRHSYEKTRRWRGGFDNR
jgi:hypothetical protein